MTLFATVRVAVAATLYLVLICVSHAQVSAQLAQKAPDAAEIVATAGQDGHVRIIVEFAGPVPAGQLRPDSLFLAAIRSQIAATQDAIIASHFGSATNPSEGQGFPRGLMRFDISPMFAVNVSNTELDALAADPRVLLIHLDRLEQPTLIQSVPLIGMPAAYSLGGTGLGQAVAILDTGVQANHTFLEGKVVMEACFSGPASGEAGATLCPNGEHKQTGAGASDPTTAHCIHGTTSLCTHGTHVAGIAAGNNTNPGGGTPPYGVAKSAAVVSVQVFTRFNTAQGCRPSAAPCILTYVSNQVAALDWVFANALTLAPGIKLAAVNMSLGGGKYTGTCDTDARKSSIDNLRAAGVVTAIAAGNEDYTNAVNAPGCISTAVTVGSSDKENNISSFTNMSPVVKLMAPGGYGSSPCALGADNANILSSISGTTYASKNLYHCFYGTSMAAPHVAGAFAAIRTACPNATVDQILTALQTTGLPIADTRTGGTLSRPRIRVDQALLQLGCGG
jgi:subtilisin family serine protease